MSESQKPGPDNQDEQQDSSQEQTSADQEQHEDQESAADTQAPPQAPPDDPSLLSDEEDSESSVENTPEQQNEEGSTASADNQSSEDLEKPDSTDAEQSEETSEFVYPPKADDTSGDAESDEGEVEAAGSDGEDSLPSETDEEEDDEEDDDEEDNGEQPMSFLDHMTELRIRLVRCLIAAGVGFLACYGFHNELFGLLMEPLVKVFPPGSSLIYTGLPEAFFTYIKVSMVAGVLLVSPYIFYQIWSFIAPGLYKDEKKYLLPIAFCSGLFFATGAIFGYSVVFPFAFGFFMEFATETIKPMPSLKEYLSFSLKLLFAFGFTFEMPLFAFFLGKLGIITAVMMRKTRKYAYLCAFVVAAILTPPDVVSQVLMAGPLIVLFEVSIWVVQIFGRKPKKSEEEEEDEADDDETDEDAHGKETDTESEETAKEQQ